MKIVRAKNYDEASVQAANYLMAQVLWNPKSVLGLATGSTPLGTYAKLIERYQNKEVSFAQTTTINLDEYIGLPTDNDQSYHYFMHHNFLDHIDISSENTHLPNGMAADVDQESEEYEALINASGGIDLQLLGLGRNGHIGFNEPCDVIPDATHTVDLTPSTIESNKRFFETAEDVPRRAITMGIGTILRAKKIVILVTGIEKAEILAKILNEPITPQIPASLLRLHPDVVLIADQEALSLC